MQVNYEPRDVHSSMRVTKSLFYMKEICVHSTVQYSTVLYSCILQIKHFEDFHKSTHVSVLLDTVVDFFFFVNCVFLGDSRLSYSRFKKHNFHKEATNVSIFHYVKNCLHKAWLHPTSTVVCTQYKEHVC